MARYIDADNLGGWLETILKDFGEPDIRIRPIAYGSENALRSVLEVVKKQPPEDVVEVVRCKDCKYYKPQEKSRHWNSEKKYCNRSATVKVNDEDFCSYGERRDNNG